MSEGLVNLEGVSILKNYVISLLENIKNKNLSVFFMKKKLKKSKVFKESVYGKNSFTRSLYFQNICYSFANYYKLKTQNCLSFIEKELSINADIEKINELSLICKNYNLKINLENREEVEKFNPNVSINDLGLFAMLIIEKYEKDYENLKLEFEKLSSELSSNKKSIEKKENNFKKKEISGLSILSKICEVDN